MSSLPTSPLRLSTHSPPTTTHYNYSKSSEPRPTAITDAERMPPPPFPTHATSTDKPSSVDPAEDTARISSFSTGSIPTGQPTSPPVPTNSSPTFPPSTDTHPGVAASMPDPASPTTVSSSTTGHDRSREPACVHDPSDPVQRVIDLYIEITDPGPPAATDSDDIDIQALENELQDLVTYRTDEIQIGRGMNSIAMKISRRRRGRPQDSGRDYYLMYAGQKDIRRYSISGEESLSIQNAHLNRQYRRWRGRPDDFRVGLYMPDRLIVLRSTDQTGRRGELIGLVGEDKCTILDWKGYPEKMSEDEDEPLRDRDTEVIPTVNAIVTQLTSTPTYPASPPALPSAPAVSASPSVREINANKARLAKWKSGLAQGLGYVRIANDCMGTFLGIFQLDASFSRFWHLDEILSSEGGDVVHRSREHAYVMLECSAEFLSRFAEERKVLKASEFLNGGHVDHLAHHIADINTYDHGRQTIAMNQQGVDTWYNTCVLVTRLLGKQVVKDLPLDRLKVDSATRDAILGEVEQAIESAAISFDGDDSKERCEILQHYTTRNLSYNQTPPKRGPLGRSSTTASKRTKTDPDASGDSSGGRRTRATARREREQELGRGAAGQGDAGDNNVGGGSGNDDSTGRGDGGHMTRQVGGSGIGSEEMDLRDIEPSSPAGSIVPAGSDTAVTRLSTHTKFGTPPALLPHFIGPLGYETTSSWISTSTLVSTPAAATKLAPRRRPFSLPNVELASNEKLGVTARTRKLRHSDPHRSGQIPSDLYRGLPHDLLNQDFPSPLFGKKNGPGERGRVTGPGRPEAGPALASQFKLTRAALKMLNDANGAETGPKPDEEEYVVLSEDEDRVPEPPTKMVVRCLDEAKVVLVMVSPEQFDRHLRSLEAGLGA